MTLFRPISIFDVDEEGVHFLYLVKGRNKYLESSKSWRNSFYSRTLWKRISAYGYQACFDWRRNWNGTTVSMCQTKSQRQAIYRITRGIVYRARNSNNTIIASRCNPHFKIGGTILDDVVCSERDTIFTCGPPR